MVGSSFTAIVKPSDESSQRAGADQNRSPPIADDDLRFQPGDRGSFTATVKPPAVLRHIWCRPPTVLYHTFVRVGGVEEVLTFGSFGGLMAADREAHYPRPRLLPEMQM